MQTGSTDRTNPISRARILKIYLVIFVVVAVPFTILHLIARPDDAPISPWQHLVAALSNFLGPWGVVAVRIVDFPNAGLRSFSWGLSIGLTILGCCLLLCAVRTRSKALQFASGVLWAVFILVWFFVGLTQIADGLM